MLAALASAALIVAGSLGLGHAVFILCGRREWSWPAGPVGLALLLALAAITADLGGRGTAIAVVVGVALVLAAVVVGRRYRGPPPELPAAGAAVLAALFTALPFIAAGAIGILGVGLVNDDMASHLLISDWIAERFKPEPVFIDQGYPLGPHALVAGLGTVLHASTVDVFAGLILALPVLTALVAYSALDGLGPWSRPLCAALVALPYMASAYLAQEAFKEPALALFVLTFALLLPKTRTARDAIPLGLLGAGTVYVYSFPGLAWLAGTLVVFSLIRLLWSDSRNGKRVGWIGLGVGVLALAVLIAPEIHRLIDFRDFRALDPDRANEGGLGNLREQLSPLTAFGIWPTSEFRLPAGAGSLPAAVFYLGGLVGLAAFALAVPRWIRRHGPAIPAAILTAALLWVAARAFGTVYTSAKALAIAAPLITLVTLGGLLSRYEKRPASGNKPHLVIGAVVALAAAFSSFLILRQAPVAPEEHQEELAQIRPLVQGEKVLFLGRDNFILWELRGSKPFTAVKNYYDPFYVEPNVELEDVFSKFDFDSVDGETLAEFPYVLTTRAAYASGAPPGYEVVGETPTYTLWKRGGDDVRDRLPAEGDAAPGATFKCGAGGRVSVFAAPPVVTEAWEPATIEDGDLASITVDLLPGTWDVSLRYDSTRPLTLSNGSELPGNLDYRGPAAFYPAGEIESEGGEVTLRAEVEEPPLAGRLLGAHSTAHLGPVAFTRAAAAELVAGRRACGEYADWFAGS